MAVTIAEQLTKLNQLRQQLAANLVAKGVNAEQTEKFNTLVPKILNISGGETPTEKIVLYDADNRENVRLLYNGTTALRTLLPCMRIFAARRTTMH